MHKHTNRMSLALVIPLGLGIFWTATAMAQAVPLCVADPGINPPVTIGEGANFAILLDGPLANLRPNTLILGAKTVVSGGAGTIGGVYANVALGSLSSVSGDVAASMFDQAPPNLSIQLGAKTLVQGLCATDGGVITPAGECLGGSDTSGTNPYVTTTPPGTMGIAVDQEECVDGAVLCQPATDAVVDVPAGGKLTLKVSSGLNVLSATDDITLGTLSTLTLSGPADAEVVLETPGAINLGPMSKIVLAHGLLAENVLITATTPPGFSEDPGATNKSRSKFITGGGVTINGEIHGEYGCDLGANNTINGAIVCDFELRAGSGLHVNHIPLAIELPNLLNPDAYPKCF
jgi:hypothetical protein